MRPLTIIASLEIATGLGIALFWALFFTVGVGPTHPPPAYFAFEYSFVLSDIVLSAALLVAGTLLVFGRNWGCALSFTCAGGLIFLGLVDFGFNIGNGIYTADLLDGVLTAAINIWCLLIGILIVTGIGTQS
jgi:hypothetical protein